MYIKILKWDRLKGTEKLTSGDNIKMYLSSDCAVELVFTASITLFHHL
jgi:hypothetical protein